MAFYNIKTFVLIVFHILCCLVLRRQQTATARSETGRMQPCNGTRPCVCHRAVVRYAQPVRFVLDVPKVTKFPDKRCSLPVKPSVTQVARLAKKTCLLPMPVPSILFDGRVTVACPISPLNTTSTVEASIRRPIPCSASTAFGQLTRKHTVVGRSSGRYKAVRLRPTCRVCPI